MERKYADIAAGMLVTGVVALGVLTAVLLFVSERRMIAGTSSTPSIAYVGPVLMSLVVASIIGGIYVYLRGRVFEVDNGSMQTDAPGESAKSDE